MKQINSIIRIFSIVVLLGSSNTDAQIITTIAGNNIAGFSGDNGQATNAAMNRPDGVALDNLGNIYFTDGLNNRVRKINSTGIITTIAGIGTAGYSGDGGAATAAEINLPEGIIVDKHGNIIFTEYGNNIIRKVDTCGIITTIAGTGTSGFSGDSGMATLAQLNEPFELCIDTIGTIYFADGANQRLRSISISGIITTLAGTGVYGFSGDGGMATNAKFNGIIGVAVDKKGNLYIADNGNNRIRKVNSFGKITTYGGNGTAGFSGDNGMATNAQLNGPQRLAVDKNNTLYITDRNNDVIRTIDTAGIIQTVAGNGTIGYAGDGGPANAAELNIPFGIAVDEARNYYIADEYNNRIRKVETTNKIQNVINEENLLQIYPNPTSDIINIKIINNYNELNIGIFDVFGRNLLTQSFTGNRDIVTIETDKLPEANYIVLIKIDGKIYRNRVSITK